MKRFLRLLVPLLFVCIASYAQTINANGPTTFCLGGNVELSIAPVSGALSYQWIKDGADIPTASTDKYVAAASGSYTIKVVHADNTPQTYTPVSVTVNNPTASFSSNATVNQCSNVEVQFTNTSTCGLTYEWNFGDPNSGASNTSTQANPRHTFIGTYGTGTQNFTVTLTVRNGAASATTSQSITVTRVPELVIDDVAPFNKFSNCTNNPSVANPNYTLTIRNDSPNPAQIASYTVDWGDGTVQANIPFSSNLTHTYTALGAFNLTVTAHPVSGTCPVTKTYVVANQSNPAGGLGTLGNTAGLCAPAAVPFVISNWQNNSPGTVYILDYGDGTSETFTHPLNLSNTNHTVTHTYTTTSCPASSFTARLTVRNACSETVFTAGNIQIWTGPTAGFTPSVTTVCQGQSVSFTNTTARGNYGNTCTDATTFSWNFGDPASGAANTSAQANPTHIFSGPGTYTVTLTATNPCSTTTTTAIICVNALPTADFSLDKTSGCGPLDVQTTNLSSTPACGSNTYQWNISYASHPGCTPATSSYSFVSGSATSANPLIRFTNPGVYTITLTTRYAGGNCSDTSNPQIVTVKAPPTVTLGAIPASICEGASINPTATVGNCASSTTETYLWSFPGAATTSSTAAAPGPIVYPTAGTYTITLDVTNECGTTTRTRSITISQVPVLNTPGNIISCRNQVIPVTAFTNAASNPSVTYTWTNNTTGIGLGASGTGNLPSFTAQNPGSAPLVATITVTPRLGSCNGAPVQFTITVNPSAPQANAGPDQSICSTASHTLNGNNPGSGTGQWTQVSSQTGVTFTDPAVFNTTVNGLVDGEIYEFKWTITGTAPCSPTSDNVLITVNPPTVGGTTAGSTTLCTGSNNGQITLSGHTGSIVRWERSVNGGTTWTTIANTGTTLTYSNLSQTTQYRAIVKNGSCNEAPSTVSTVTINPATASANAGPDQAICNLTTTTLAANDPGAATGTWTQVSGQTVTIADASLFNTGISGLVNGQSYEFEWTIAGAAPCPSTSDRVIITVAPPSVGGTAGGSAAHCAGNATGQVTLSGHTGTIVRWERSTDNGNTWNTAAGTANPFSYSNLGQTTQFRAVVKSGNCTEATSAAATVTVNAATAAANAGQDQTVCNATSATLAGNNPGTGSGAWTLTSGQAGVTFADATQFNTTVNGLTGGQTYIFRWTITGTAPCAPTTDDMRLTNLAPISNTVTAGTTTFCAGQTMTINGSAPTGGNNSYTYRWESSPDNITWTVINSQTGQNLNMTVTSSLYFRRVVISGGCSMNSNEVQITVQPAIAGNTISAAQTICSGQVPALISGSTPTGGDGNYAYQWQSSANGNTWNNINGQLSADYQPQALSSSTHFRRLVTTAVCSGLQPSNTVIITVSPHARAELTYTSDRGCTPFALTAQNIKAVAYPDRNSQYTWYANNTQIGTGITFPGYTIQNSNESVHIRLVVSSSLGCNQDEASHTFSTMESVTPSFTQDKTNGCGPLAVAFTNTSSSFTAATFRWNFGNGITSTLVSPPPVTFQANPAGKDTTYVVTLQAITACKTETFTSAVLVKANPLSVFSPDRTIGCSPMTVNFSNTSPGSNTTYHYDFGDGQTLTTTNKNPVSHTYFTGVTRDYTVRMVAENECGRNESQYTIRVTPNTILPELVVNSNEKTGCAPYTVNFHNNTKGASSFIYDFGDGSRTVSTTISPEIMRHTFTQPGTYTVTLRALNGCSDTTTTETVTVLPQPAAGFSANVLKGCPGLNVTFSNNSVGAVSYRWDFGDGTTSPLPAPSHSFSGDQPFYTVRLIAINANGCSDTITRVNYINIVQPPDAQFDVSPSVRITIPNYTFNFADRSTNGADSWQWDFGDGMSSNRQNPSHSYTDTGTYRVVLRVFNQDGCVDSTFKDVHIDGVPGHLNLANAFIPGSAIPELRTFKAKGTGIKKWHMKIFNKWGQTIWESTALDIDGVPTEGWDGTFKGEAVPQGVYVWTIEVEFINGSEWKGMSYNGSPPKRSGVIHLIR